MLFHYERPIQVSVRPSKFLVTGKSLALPLTIIYCEHKTTGEAQKPQKDRNQQKSTEIKSSHTLASDSASNIVRVPVGTSACSPTW